MSETRTFRIGLSMSGARMIGIGLAVLGLVCGITSTAIDYWYYYSASSGTFVIHSGLWELCKKDMSNYSKPIVMSCSSWSSLGDKQGDELIIAWRHACQAMMIIGLVMNAAACGTAIYATMKHMPPPRITKVAAAVAGVCYLIAASLFLAASYGDISDGRFGGHLHVGFGLAIVAGLTNLISVCVLDSKHSRIRDGYVQQL